MRAEVDAAEGTNSQRIPEVQRSTLVAGVTTKTCFASRTNSWIAALVVLTPVDATVCYAGTLIFAEVVAFEALVALAACKAIDALVADVGFFSAASGTSTFDHFAFEWTSELWKLMVWMTVEATVAIPARFANASAVVLRAALGCAVRRAQWRASFA